MVNNIFFFLFNLFTYLIIALNVSAEPFMIKTKEIIQTPEFEKLRTKAQNEEVKNYRDILEHQIEDTSSKPKQNLKDLIKNKSKDMKDLKSETSKDNSKLMAKIKLKKDIIMEMSNYESETRSNPNDSFYDKTQNPDDEIIDKDPKLRDYDLNKQLEGDGDVFEFDKKVKKSNKPQVYDDEEIIRDTSIVGHTHSKPNKQNSIPANKSKSNKKDIKGMDPPKSSVTVNIDEKAIKKQKEENKDLNELHDLLHNNNEKENTDLKKQLDNVKKAKIIENEINSRTSAHRSIKLAKQEEFEHYESDQRSVNEEIYKIEEDKDEENTVEVEPKLSKVNFK